jgi:hypothetical protein
VTENPGPEHDQPFDWSLSPTPRYGPPVAALVADSGVQSCKSIAAGRSASPTASASTDAATTTMTADQYRTVRAQFSHSRYADLRTAGTHFVDLVWQAAGATDGSDGLGAALALLGPLVSAYSDLSGACANHGVVLPPLGD